MKPGIVSTVVSINFLYSVMKYNSCLKSIYVYFKHSDTKWDFKKHLGGPVAPSSGSTTAVLKTNSSNYPFLL